MPALETTDVKALARARAAFEYMDGSTDPADPFMVEAAFMVEALAQLGFAIVPVAPTPAMVVVTVQQVGDPSPEQWALAERICNGLTGPHAEGEAACATLIRDWQNMIAATKESTA